MSLRSPAPRVVFVAAYLALACLVALQVTMSNVALNVPLYVPGFLRARALETFLGLAIYLPLLALVDRLAKLERVGMPRHLAVALAVIAPAAFVVAATPRFVPLVGIGVSFKGSVLAKGLSELVVVTLALALSVALDVHRRWRARESHALQLEASLVEARLQALASQLQPHFLFNTLNAISVILHRDPRAADAMLVALADLLRATLGRRDAHEIPLDEELALLERYLEIMRYRYGERLTVEVTVAADARDLLVPPFVLQPLVENALEHGVGRRAGPGSVRIRVSRHEAQLRLEVIDDGVGLALVGARRETGEGIGLSTTRRRLEQLYGGAQRLVLEAGADGRGARAIVELPARRVAGSAVA